ncbi:MULTISPECIES: ABC transporter permease [Pseudobutyrivibrio]|uniref:ABC transporter permease n=1 Tax=Pseudobutyrivibrio xylanivorans TaxID=185007 RepID=A0A6M0LIX1_PSEXY|nr:MULTISPECIES: ABC transporter permease [Pseudobutyrivibrio]NEX02394.1 ABC transporter permease [Pseudobutyrivibrio xylanivorans]
MRYLLLLKRLLKKKSYIAMLLVVPLMVFMLNIMSSADAGLMTIGVYIPKDDEYCRTLRENIENNPGSLQFIFYDDKDEAISDVEHQQIAEAWIIPEDFEKTVSDMATKGRTKEKIEIVIRESGLTHMLGREVLCSRVYPLVAREIGIKYTAEAVYNNEPTDAELSHIIDTYDTYGINGNLFEMGYVDQPKSNDTDVSYLMMPLRGILALWLLLCGVAASMYYIEDDKNSLFIWWKTKFPLVRDFLYYLVIILIPSIMVLIGLAYGGVFTNPLREVVALLAYDFAVICLASVLRLLIRGIKGLGIITPILIMSSAILAPVFIDLKEGRYLQKFFPTFHYLYCIHDEYYVKSLLFYGTILLLIWYLLNTLSRRFR